MVQNLHILGFQSLKNLRSTICCTNFYIMQVYMCVLNCDLQVLISYMNFAFESWIDAYHTKQEPKGS